MAKKIITKAGKLDKRTVVGRSAQGKSHAPKAMAKKFAKAITGKLKFK